MVAAIAEFAPNLPSTIVGRQVLTPLDIERVMGLSEGNIFQGELSLEQLFFNRPTPGMARFRTPIEALAGGLGGPSRRRDHGRAGRIAALEVLRADRGEASGVRPARQSG